MTQSLGHLAATVSLDINPFKAANGVLMNVGRKSRDFSHGMDRPLQAR